MNEWIKSGDNGLKNEAMKWAINQDNIEFEHDDEGKVVGIVENRNEKQVALVN